jgi:sarcosine oxidase subunit beta
MSELTYDAVIIGAGVIGSSIALELARGGRRVCVVDRGTGPGTGSTSASSAVVRYNYSTWTGVVAAWESKFAWEDWEGHLGHRDSAGLARFYKVGGLILESPGQDRAKVLGLFDQVGVPYEVWDPATVRERLPLLDPGRYHPPKRIDDEAFWADATGEVTGVWTPDSGFIDDPQLAAHNLMAAAQQLGAQLRVRAEVVTVDRAAGRVAGVTLADGTRLVAPVVVNAAGPHSGAINTLADVLGDFNVGTRPMRQEVHHVAAPQGYGVGAPGPLVADLDLGTYFRGTPGDGLLVGGTEPECDPLEWIDDPDAANVHPTVPRFTAQVTRAARRMPGLEIPHRPRGVAGVYDAASDWTPIYDRTSAPGFYVAMGTSGNQFKNAPVVGQLMTVLIDAVESGHEHDAEPVFFVGPRTGHPIDLGTFSRLRDAGAGPTSVMG